MSRFRRVAAALFGALLLQVVSLGSGTACLLPTGSHASAIVEVASSETDAHAMHHAAPAPAALDGNGAPEYEPGGNEPAHCLMAVTCATAMLVAGPAFVEEDLVLDTRAIAAHDDDVPPSAGGAPEPPPPRV